MLPKMCKETFLEIVTKQYSGTSMFMAVNGKDEDDIVELLGDIPHRVIDAMDAKALDDKMLTVIKGIEELSQTEFACFVSQMESLRFRNVVILPTKKWFRSEPFQLCAWIRFLTDTKEKFRKMVHVIDLEESEA